jgi:hypothetical protein
VRNVKRISLSQKQMIDKLIIEYIINKMAPINTVDDEVFRKLIHFFNLPISSCPANHSKLK